MKKIKSYSLAMLVMAIFSMLGACSDYTPKGYEEVTGLETVRDLKASVENRVVTLTWALPSAKDITGVRVMRDGDFHNAVTLEGAPTTYSVKGQPMDQTVLYTVKVLYSDNHVSEGVSVDATVPFEELPAASGVRSEVAGRTVTLHWSMPSAAGITGVRILCNGSQVAEYEGAVTNCELKQQPMGEELVYSVEVIYDGFYAAKATSAAALVIEKVATKAAYLLLADSPSQLPDDDERAAAAWFATLPDAEFVTISQIASLDPEEYTVLWIEVDRVGLAYGWENLPDGISSPETIAALKAYTAAGGNLYLSNMATQLTVPLGIVPDNMAPSIFGNGDGGSGDDVWVINPFLGVDFKDNGAQGYYDRTAHAIYKDITLEDPNGYGYLTVPLIGPGQREDHNCMWDCNLYGNGGYADVIKNFEVTTNSLVLATWGHVRDHCVAGLVDFNPNSQHGRCVANGFAAYEWNQNSGTNPYQHNVEQLTLNIINYLK
ncbi:MAG: DUF4960 domain-containing protein [Muribaculaceae bacterium]|nr:DUF4960 domain-containing protein [Muribaculaceae bacterium]